MLILTRRAMQTVTIGKDITVQVMEIRGDQVRIAVTAPAEVLVLRAEVPDKGRAARHPPASGS